MNWSRWSGHQANVIQSSRHVLAHLEASQGEALAAETSAVSEAHCEGNLENIREHCEGNLENIHEHCEANLENVREPFVNLELERERFETLENTHEHYDELHTVAAPAGGLVVETLAVHHKHHEGNLEKRHVRCEGNHEHVHEHYEAILGKLLEHYEAILEKFHEHCKGALEEVHEHSDGANTATAHEESLAVETFEAHHKHCDVTLGNVLERCVTHLCHVLCYALLSSDTSHQGTDYHRDRALSCSGALSYTSWQRWKGRDLYQLRPNVLACTLGERQPLCCRQCMFVQNRLWAKRAAK